MPRRGRRGLVVLGGLVGLALSPAVARQRVAVLARLDRLRHRAGDPVEAFLEAPCHRGEAPAADGEATREAGAVR
ncbi:MAG: hypothetical protein AB1416_13165 [Actinomycetota bacterium]